MSQDITFSMHGNAVVFHQEGERDFCLYENNLRQGIANMEMLGTIFPITEAQKDSLATYKRALAYLVTSKYQKRTIIQKIIDKARSLK